MKVQDFNFDLPEELIAQEPLAKRDESRLLVLHRESGKLEHRTFKNIIEYLNEGDCIVLNNSRVIPARLFGVKEDTGANMEFVLLKELIKINGKH